MTSLELLTCMILIFISGFLSSSEVALFSLSRFQLRSMKERVRSGFRKIKRLLGDPGGLLITILVINEVVNISLSSVLTQVASRLRQNSFGSTGSVPDWAVDTLIGILISAPIVLFACEITPKIIGAKANQLIASLTCGPISLVYDLMKPVRIVLKHILDFISRKSSGTPPASPPDREIRGDEILKESDFMLMVEEGHKEGAIHENELELIRNVFELDDTTVQGIYTPLSQVRTLPMNLTLKMALIAMRGLQYSRIPVIGGDRKQVIGIAYSKDLLRAKLAPEMMGMTVAEIMRKPVFVTPTMRLNTLFRKFKQSKSHMAVVQDASGNSIGIVTMNDIFDALFEDLFPESEPEEEVTGEIRP